METADFRDKENGDSSHCKPEMEPTKVEKTDNSSNGSSSSLPRGFLKMWKKFGDSTTMHGLGRAINSSRVWKRIVWSILVLGAAGIASRNLYMTFVDYFSYPVSTTVSLETKLSLDFPAVTICNLNSYRFKYLKDEIKEALEKSMKDSDSVRRQKEIFTMLSSQHYNMFLPPENITHTLINMLIDCHFDMEPCVADDFIIVPNVKNGDCYTFNADLSKRRISTRAGNKNGLVMELDVEQDDYLPFTPASGFKVLVHPPGSVPFPYEDGIVVRPGVSTNIGVRKVSIERQIPPWGTCIKEEDTHHDNMNMFGTKLFNDHKYKYSRMACEKTCYQLELLRQCKCCDFVYPCFQSPDTVILECNSSSYQDLDCLNKVRRNYLSGKLPCMSRCWPPCKESVFKLSYSVAAWPSVKFVDNFNKKAAEARLKRNLTGQITPEELRRNFVRLEVHYEQMTEESIIASPAYNWNKLLSDLGGQLGLWMGFSIMTAIEFLELGLDFAGKICCACRGGSQRSDATKC